MRLDQSRIAIHERSWLDNLDLALQVMRAYAGPLALCALAGIGPMIVINCWLLDQWYGDWISEEAAFSQFMAGMLLVMVEAPLATAPITLFLGQALFQEKPSPRQIAHEFFASLPQLLILQFFLRALFIAFVVTWIIPYVLWPYLSEIILLERNRLISRRGQISTLKRNANLHRGNSGDFMARAIGAAFFAPMMILGLLVTWDTLLDWLFGFTGTPLTDLLGVQLTLWLVVAFFTVSRFLSYLDLRIRNEGWEVELFLRAQRERLLRQIA